MEDSGANQSTHTGQAGESFHKNTQHSCSGVKSTNKHVHINPISQLLLRTRLPLWLTSSPITKQSRLDKIQSTERAITFTLLLIAEQTHINVAEFDSMTLHHRNQTPATPKQAAVWATSAALGTSEKLRELSIMSNRDTTSGAPAGKKDSGRQVTEG